MGLPDDIIAAMDMLDDLSELLIAIDDFFAANDINNATKKTHEAMLKVKIYKECLESEYANKRN